MKPIHVLVLITVMDRAGAETMAMNYMRNIDRNIIKYDFLINRPEKSDYEDEIEKLGGTVYHMSSLYPNNIFRYQKEFREFLTEHPYYQVIHSHLEERSYFAFKIAAQMGIPVRICHGHSHPTRFNIKLPARYFLKFIMRKYYTHAMACSRDVARWLFGEEGAKKAMIMKNAVDTSLFRRDVDAEKEIREEFGIEDKLVIGHVGRFVKEKNQKFLVDIFSEIHRRNPDSVLLLVGGGENRAESRYKEKIKERVQEMRLESSVIFAGVRNDIERIMQTFDVLVMPSISEGFPVTLVEAQSIGIRCVVSDEISPSCNLSGNVEFFPLELRASVWAGRILKLLSQPVTESSYKVVDKGYDVRSSVRKLQKFYITEVKKCKLLESAKSYPIK